MSKALVSFNTSYVNHVENGIAPPMHMAVTIPVQAECEGKRIHGIVLYIGIGTSVPKPKPEEFQSIVEAVVEQLEAREG